MKTIYKIQDMMAIVKTLLTQYESYRDNDRKLIAHIWMTQLGGIHNMQRVNFHDFMTEFVANENIISPETISRARRKVQEQYPSLRGKLYKKRKEEEILVAQNINK